LDDRLSLFDDVVGDTRPVLTGVESEISELALEGGDQTDIKDLVDEKEREAAEMKSKVDATGLSADERQTFDESSLSGWDEQKHPALASLGSKDRVYEPVVNVDAIEYLFTQSSILEEAGWSFTTLRNHERKDDYPDAVHDAYLLTVPDESTDPAVTAASAEATAQDSLRKDDSIAVTFSPDLAKDFPSLRLLLPGDPLFTRLLEIIQSKRTDLRQDSIISFVSHDGQQPVKLEQIDSVDTEVVVPTVSDGDIGDIGLNTYSEQVADGVLRKWASDGS
jgi:hypothetical protein